MLEGVSRARALLAEQFAPDGLNVGFNEGEAAGQTIPHFHIHVIPRRTGDIQDPRGGVRHVIPEKGNYLVSPTPSLEVPAIRSLGTPHDRRLIAGGEDALNIRWASNLVTSFS